MSTNIFKASNGVTMHIDKDGDLQFRDSEDVLIEWLAHEAHEATAEYFQHQRDKELGRWRDPEKPEFVCYPYEDPRWVTVIDEKSGSRYYYSRAGVENGTTSVPSIVAERYFAAHPLERPWEEAKEGEVWVITHEGVEGPAIVSDDEHFESPDYVSGIYNKAITAGYRIWPNKED